MHLKMLLAGAAGLALSINAIGTRAQSQTAASATAPSVYTLEQAEAGATVYQQHCAQCHGDTLEGLTGPGLRAHAFREMAASQGWTGYSLLNIISTNEPEDAPASLSPEDYRDVLAYILQLNGYPSGKDKNTVDSTSLRDLDLSK